MPTLQTIVGSTRPGRIGSKVAGWFVDQARAHGGFDVELIELADLALPMFDEPHHPKLRNYQHEHTRRWSALVAGADAFAVVLPEYNHSLPPALVNALDYLVVEWAYAPVGIVSYGGVSGGIRAAQILKPVLTGLRAPVVPEAVILPFVERMLDAKGQFDPGENQGRMARGMLDELGRWTGALAGLRAEARAKLAS